jgi:nitroreductase
MSEPLMVPQAILSRRALRKFDPSRPLPDDLLVRILGLATHAPSSYNLQPWRFVVVRSEKNRQRLRACAFNQPKVTEAPVVVIVLGYTRGFETDLGPMLDRRVSLGGMRPEAAAETRGRVAGSLANHPDRASWALRSAMLAAGTMMIAAQGFGVDSAPMEGFDAARIKQEFGVPDDHVVCCLVCLGYALERDPFPGRFDLEHLCYEEHFGQPWTLGEPPAKG